MNLSSSVRSLVVTAAVAATAGFGLGAVATTSSSAAVGTKPASPVVNTAEPTYEHSRPNRMSVEMRRYLDGKGAKPEADGSTRQISGDGAGVRILPHDVKGP